MLRLRLLGNPSVEGGKGPLIGSAAHRKSLALLALLAVARDRGVSRDKILAYLWPDAEADRASHRLSQLLHALRKDLDAEALFLGTSDLRLNPEPMSTDVGEFLGALDRADLEGAVSLYAGPFLDGFFLSDAVEFERWVESERALLAKRCDAALEALATAAEQRCDWRAAAQWWHRLAEADPLNSHTAVRLIRALSAAGDRAAALEFARTHEQRLHDELDAAPDPAVRAAVERIRTAPADLPAPAPAVTSREPGAPITALAVLPFANLSPDREDEYFSDGMTDELINALTQVRELRVASRTSSFTFKGKQADVREIGDRLRVGAIVEGSVRKAANRVRITAQLVTVSDGYHLWSETYERTLADVFAVQQELAQAIVNALSLKLVGAPVVRPSTEILDAYTLYLRARYRANQRTSEGLKAGSEYFQRAIDRDPSYALAHAGLAECLTLRGFDEFGADLPPVQAMASGRAAASRALELDPNLAEAHGWLGAIALLYEWDWAGAEREFQHGLSLNSRAVILLVWYSTFLWAMQRHEESITTAQRAEALDPTSPLVQTAVGRSLHFAGRLDEGRARFRAALEMDPNYTTAWAWLAEGYSAKGMLREAADVLEQAMTRLGRLRRLLMVAGLVRGQMGQRDEALRILGELRQRDRDGYVPAMAEAYVLAGLGETDETFSCLNRAYDERSGYLAFARSTYVWRSIRCDQRFTALLRKIGHAVPDVAPTR